MTPKQRNITILGTIFTVSLAAAVILTTRVISKSITTHARESADPEFVAVDKFLRENLDDGGYEVVKFWPAKDRSKIVGDWIAEPAAKLERTEASLQKLEAEKAKTPDGTNEALRLTIDIRQAGFDIQDAKDQIENFKRLMQETSCRLKFRSRNRVGGNELRDAIFVFKDGQIARVVESNDPTVEWKLRERMFAADDRD